MKRRTRATTRSKRRRIRKLVGIAITSVMAIGLAAVAGFYVGWTRFASALPELRGWHLDEPASEFTQDDEQDGYTLDDYLAQEAQVFDELDQLIAQDWSPTIDGRYSRFLIDSPSNPDLVSNRNWNRSLLLTPEQPIGAAILLHGLSDSPYSLRDVGMRLYEQGWSVLWLRVPGHGTCPAALAEVDWQDWTAAVRVAVKGMRTKASADSPLIIVGYSNGGALAVDYAATALDDPDLPVPDRLILMSPMIGISSLARLTEFHSIVGRISGLEKVGWQSVNAEVDPFKYSSWPMNASVQAFHMTKRLERKLRRLSDAGQMESFPRTLVFQSVIDATVVAPELVKRFLSRCVGPGNELIVFDSNQDAEIANLVRSKFRIELATMLEDAGRHYGLTVVTNESPDTHSVVAKRYTNEGVVTEPLELEWPRDVFSLSHLAIPIPPDDPILGDRPATRSRLPLGSLSIRGESGVLMISESLMFRLRHNPFYDFLAQELFRWLSGVNETQDAPPTPT